MYYATACRHPVHSARLNGLHAADAVSMEYFAGKKVSNGRESDMGMRSHVEPFTLSQYGRAHLVKEDEWPNRSLLS